MESSMKETHIISHTKHTHAHIHIYIYIYILNIDTSKVSRGIWILGVLLETLEDTNWFMIFWHEN